MQRNNAKLKMNFNVVEKYLNIFYTPGGNGGLTLVPSSLHIELDDRRSKGEDFIDLLPLMLLLIKMPGIAASFTPDEDINMDVLDENEYDDLNQILHNKHGSWLDTVSEGKLANVLAYRRGCSAGVLHVVFHDSKQPQVYGHDVAREGLGFELTFYTLRASEMPFRFQDL